MSVLHKGHVVETTPLQRRFRAVRIEHNGGGRAMFLRRNRRKKNGESYDYWTLVESVRTARGPRQRTVATIGKLPGLDREARVGWEHIADILDGKARQEDFLQPAAPDPPE